MNKMYIPFVSVVIPTHNRADLLERSINSVLCQSYKNLEVIVVDDASTDHTASVIEKINDSRLRYLRLEQNVGGAEARNIGISVALGDFVAFQDSDDEWRCSKLSNCLEAFKDRKDVVAVFSRSWKIKDNKCSLAPGGSIPKVTKMGSQYLLRGNYIDTPTAVVKKSALDSVGHFDPSLPRYQDWDLFIRLSSVGDFFFIDDPLILSYDTAGSISNNYRAHFAAIKVMYSKYNKEIKRDRFVHARWLNLLGDAEFLVGEKPQGVSFIFRSLAYSPKNIKYMAQAVVSLFFSRKVYSWARLKFSNVKLP